MAAPKSVQRSRQVKTPNANSDLINEGECLVIISFQFAQPMLQGENIMFAQVFYNPNFKAGGFHGTEHDRERRNIAIGKHVFLDERAIRVVRSPYNIFTNGLI